MYYLSNYVHGQLYRQPALYRSVILGFNNQESASVLQNLIHVVFSTIMKGDIQLLLSDRPECKP